MRSRGQMPSPLAASGYPASQAGGKQCSQKGVFRTRPAGGDRDRRAGARGDILRPLLQLPFSPLTWSHLCWYPREEWLVCAFLTFLPATLPLKLLFVELCINNWWREWVSSIPCLPLGTGFTKQFHVPFTVHRAHFRQQRTGSLAGRFHSPLLL